MPKHVNSPLTFINERYSSIRSDYYPSLCIIIYHEICFMVKISILSIKKGNYKANSCKSFSS